MPRSIAKLPAAILCATGIVATAAAAPGATIDPLPRAPFAIETASISGPSPILRVPPSFPAKARRRGVERARVVIQAIIDRDGSVIDPVVLACDRPGLGFERAALKAARRYRYTPATLDGRPVEVYFSIAIDFSRESTDDGRPPGR